MRNATEQKRRRLAMRWGTGALLLGLLLRAMAPAAEVVPFDPALPAGTHCRVAIERLHPTQFAVGYWEVDRRAENIARKGPKKLAEYLQEHVPLIVVGSGGTPYLIDGHHLCLALLKAKRAESVDARIEANWRDLKPEDFWQRMKQKSWVYLYDARGDGPLEPARLPKKLTALADDPYRALAWAVRERGGYKKSSESFAEFKWANFFRRRIRIGSGPGDFERAIDAALKLSHSPEAKDLPGYIGPKQAVHKAATAGGGFLVPTLRRGNEPPRPVVPTEDRGNEWNRCRLCAGATGGRGFMTGRLASPAPDPRPLASSPSSPHGLPS